VPECDSFRHELADHDVQEREDQVREDHGKHRRNRFVEKARQSHLAQSSDAQRSERHAELHRRDEARWIGGNAQHVAGASVALVLQLDDARPSCRHEAVFGRDKEGVQEDQNADGDELEEDRHAPTPWAVVLGGISSSNYGEV
jgi:hypothetical protein